MSEDGYTKFLRESISTNITLTLVDGTKIWCEADGYSCSHRGYAKGSCIKCVKYVSMHLSPLLQSCIIISQSLNKARKL